MPSRPNYLAVFAMFARNIDRLRALVLHTIRQLPTVRDCLCPTVLDGLHTNLALPG